MNHNLRKHFFSNRIITVWNKPIDVIYADSTNMFKNRLDMFWFNQDLKFDWNADITGIGSRSLKYI